MTSSVCLTKITHTHTLTKNVTYKVLK